MRLRSRPMESLSRLQELTGLPRNTLQNHMRDCMRGILIEMSPNLNVPQQQLLEEFDRLVPGLLAADGTSTLLVAPSAEAPPRLAFEHICKHLTCSANNRFCKLCERNPLKRCSSSSNFATKQFETQVLRAPCDAAIKVLFARGQMSTQAAAAESGSTSVGSAEQEVDDVCLEPFGTVQDFYAAVSSASKLTVTNTIAALVILLFSLLNGSIHDSWLQQGHEGLPMDEEMRGKCEVLACTKQLLPEPHRKKPDRASEARRPLLEGGPMTEHTPQLRVRAMLQGGRVSLSEFFVHENSEAQMGREMTYKMLVRAINPETNQELAQLVSESFIVTTMRSRNSVKPNIPFGRDSVDKLEGLGARTKMNLSNVRACVGHIDARAVVTVPKDAPNMIATVDDFKQLEESLRGWASCSRAIRRALLPEAAVEHSQKVLPPDSRVRSWQPDQQPDCGLLYCCSQAQVEFGNPAVLVEPTEGMVASHFVLASRASSDQLVRMQELASQAFNRWQEAGHPGWDVTEADSNLLLGELEQGVMPFSGRLADLRLQISPAAVAGGSQDMSDVAQANSRLLSDPLASITSRINRGSLEDRPSSSSAGPAPGQGLPGQFGAALEQELWQGHTAAMPDDPLNLLSGLVIPGMPIVDLEVEAARPQVFRREQQAGHLSASLPSRRSTSSQPNPVPELLTQQSLHRSFSLQSPFPLTRQLPGLDPQRQQQLQQQLQFQQQPQFGLPAGFETNLNSMGFMSSSQLPQLQAFPASQGLAKRPSLDTSSSQSGGRVSRRSGSHGLRSSPRSPVQIPGQKFAFSEAQQGQGQGLPAVPLRRATSLSLGAVGALGTGPMGQSPSQSPSPQDVPALSHGLQQAYGPPSRWYPEGPSQEPLGGSPQVVAHPSVPTHQPEAYQIAPGQNWDPSGPAPPLVAAHHPVPRSATSLSPEPALKRHQGSPPQSPSQAPPPDMIPQHRTHSAPTQGSLPPGWLPGPTLQQGSSQQPLSGRSFLPGGGPPSSQQQAWSEGYGRGAWGGSGGCNLASSLPGSPAAPAVEVAQSQPLLGSAPGPGAGAGAQGQFHGLTDFPADPSSPPSQAAHPLQDLNLPGCSHMAESQGASINDAAQSHAPAGGLLDQQRSAMDDSHSGAAGLQNGGFDEGFMAEGGWFDMPLTFPATPPPAAETPAQPHPPNRLSEEGVQHVKGRVQLSSSRVQGRAEQAACAEEVHRGKAEADRSKGTAMLSALASGGSLNLSQELVVRDCCFKWKQGARNMKSLANSSTVGSSRCRRGFYRTDSQTHTCDSDLRSLMSIDDMNELVRTLPTAIEA